ncbi:MAG: DUF1573 domain-containing protein [Ignavibacteriaceae bacterium]|nr:DUF1573 domain-containing protein [Ignavibacteriaceae bacterium]
MLNKMFVFILFISFTMSAQILGPKAVTQQLEFDFGNVQEGKSVENYFVVTNSGGDLLKILNVRASCGCTAAKPDKDFLKPGESAKINFNFNTTGRFGHQEKFVYVNTNDPNNKEIKFKFYGDIVQAKTVSKTAQPRISFTKTQHDYGIVKEGGIYGYTFQFKNNGKGTLIINDVKTSCGCTAVLLSNKEIKPGSDGTLKVELDTKNRVGRMSRTITIVSNDPEEPNKVLTIFAEPRKETN